MQELKSLEETQIYSEKEELKKDFLKKYFNEEFKENFLRKKKEKNKNEENLNIKTINQILNITKNSKNKLISSFLYENNNEDSRFEIFNVLNNKFYKDLAYLDSIVRSTHSFLVFCLKPFIFENNSQIILEKNFQPNFFDKFFVVQQISSFGFSQLESLRSQSFTHRFSFASFFSHFSSLSSKLQSCDTKENFLKFVNSISHLLNKDEYSIGNLLKKKFLLYFLFIFIFIIIILFFIFIFILFYFYLFLFFYFLFLFYFLFIFIYYFLYFLFIFIYYFFCIF